MEGVDGKIVEEVEIEEAEEVQEVVEVDVVEEFGEEIDDAIEGEKVVGLCVRREAHDPAAETGQTAEAAALRRLVAQGRHAPLQNDDDTRVGDDDDQNPCPAPPTLRPDLRPT